MAVPDTDVAASTLTKSQAARRERVIEAARALGSEGGYEVVQMREVADRADVALGTIYRYFSSKDHLLAAVLVQWALDLEAQVTKRLPHDPTTSDRLVKILQRAARAMEADPDLSRAVLTAMSKSDPRVQECQREAAQVMARIQLLAFDDDFDPEACVGVIRLLGQVWFAALIGWVNGWSNITKVSDELEFAARFLLDPYE